MRIFLLMAPLILTLLPTAQAEDVADDHTESEFRACAKDIYLEKYSKFCVNVLLAIEKKHNLCEHGAREEVIRAICQAGIWRASPDDVFSPAFRGPYTAGWPACCEAGYPNTLIHHWRERFDMNRQCQVKYSRPCITRKNVED